MLFAKKIAIQNQKERAIFAFFLHMPNWTALVFSAVLLPQDANDTATTAANKNANFFIFFAF